MVLQVLSPSVEHGEKTGPGSQVFRVGRDFEQSFRCCPEQDSIHHALILYASREYRAAGGPGNGDERWPG